MLSKGKTALLCRLGPGTPTKSLMKESWLRVPIYIDRKRTAPRYGRLLGSLVISPLPLRSQNPHDHLADARCLHDRPRYGVG